MESKKTYLTRKKLIFVLVLSSLVFVLIAFASQIIPFVLLGLPQTGLSFLIVGLIQVSIGVYAITFSLKRLQLTLSDIGFTSDHLRSDIFIGALVAIAFAALQFLLIIPATGGAERSDVVANSAQIGKSITGLVSMFGEHV